MAEITNELLFEVLKQIQGRLANIEAGLVDVKTELQALRVHALGTQTDISNLYSGQSRIERRLERIERRLELADAPLA